MNYPTFACTPAEPVTECKYGGLNEEQLAAAKVWSEYWIDNAFRQTPMTWEEFQELPERIAGLYRSGDLEVPEVVLCESPFGCVQAMDQNGYDATKWSDTYQGGNMWSAVESYVTYFRHVLNLTIPEHEKYDDWEWLAQHGGGFRMMLEKHCFISNYPTKILRELHCDDGPTHEWSDGFAIWHINDIAVDEQIVMNPESQTIEQINKEENADVRTIRIERFGWSRYLEVSDAKEIDFRDNDVEGTKEALYATDQGRRFVVTCPTGKVPTMGVPDEVTTCEEAQRWLQGDKPFNLITRT